MPPRPLRVFELFYTSGLWSHPENDRLVRVVLWTRRPRTRLLGHDKELQIAISSARPATRKDIVHITIDKVTNVTTDKWIILKCVSVIRIIYCLQANVFHIQTFNAKMCEWQNYARILKITFPCYVDAFATKSTRIDGNVFPRPLHPPLVENRPNVRDEFEF
jgi:hypothetical protein